jgi:radical SAM superfamily enzyme YgiQ (UPF0313 family)
MPFLCHLRSGVEDEDFIRDLSESGCVSVVSSAETGNERLRYEVLNKHISDQQLFETARLLRKYELSMVVNNMYCLPESKPEDAWKTIDLMRRIKPNHTINSCFKPYPELPISERLFKDGVLKNLTFGDSDGMFEYPSYLTNHREQLTIYHFSYLLIKFPWLDFFLKSHIKHIPHLLSLAVFKVTAGINYWRRYSLGLMRFLRELLHNYDYK